MDKKRNAKGGLSMKNLTVRRQDTITGYAMVLPAFVLIAIFSIVPMLATGVLSFFDWSFYRESTFVGLENYRKVVNDPVFWKSMLVAVKFTFWNMSISMLLAFIVAVTIKRLAGRMGGAMKTLIYIPSIMSGIITAYIFRFMYNFRGGFLNTIIGFLGIAPQTWTTGPATAMFSMVLPSIWLAVGVKALMLLAGLNDIPQTYYEAASLDGAGGWKQMWHITLPCLRNVFVYLVITSISSAMQMFDLSFAVTGGGPQNSTLMPVLYVYNRFRYDPYMGPSMSAALLLFVVLGSFSWLVFKTVNSDKALDG